MVKRKKRAKYEQNVTGDNITYKKVIRKRKSFLAWNDKSLRVRAKGIKT